MNPSLSALLSVTRKQGTQLKCQGTTTYKSILPKCPKGLRVWQILYKSLQGAMTFWVFLNPEASRKNICKDHKFGKENIHSLNQVITFARKLTLTHRFFLCVNKKLEEVGGRLNSRLAYLRSLPYNSSGSHSKWSHTILFTHCLGLTWDVCDGSHGTPKGTGTLKIADRPTEHPTQARTQSSSLLTPLRPPEWRLLSRSGTRRYSLRLINRAGLSQRAYQQSSFSHRSSRFPTPTDYRATKSQRVI